MRDRSRSERASGPARRRIRLSRSESGEHCGGGGACFGKAAEIPIASDLLDALGEYQQFNIQQGRICPTIQRCSDVWKRDLRRAGIEFLVRGERAEPKGLRKSFESHLLRSGCDPIITMLLMRHTPEGGMGLTMGVYADQDELRRRKTSAIRAMTAWQQEQRTAVRKATG